MRYAPETFDLLRDDHEKQNWYWLQNGTMIDRHYAEALDKAFSEAQRSVMQNTPEDALAWFEAYMPKIVTDAMRGRVREAQARLFPPLIKTREGNVVYANFRRKVA